MRLFPFATLGLAAVLSSAPLSAHSRHLRLTPEPQRFTPRSAHSTHIQHPQPAVFEPSVRASSHRRRHPAAIVPVSHARSRRQLSTSRTRRPQPRQRLPISRPSRQTSVLSIIRPTADHPQLPPIQQAAAQPTILPTLYNDRGRLIMPAPLLGSHEILVRQNEVADQDGLGRVQDDADLDGMRRKGLLVAIPAGQALRVDDRLPFNRRFCRPWTAQFLDALARAHFARFGTPIQVNSAVRTVSFQLRLQRTNGNAAPAEGDTASPHLTGQAIDIGKRGLTLTEIAWIRGYLLPLIQESRVDVEEEFQQSCFHISVYRRYLPADSIPPRYTVSARTPSTLATGFR